MEKRPLKWCAAVLMVGLILGPVSLLPAVADEREEGASDPNLVSGFITVVKRHEILINGKEYALPGDVTFYDEDGQNLKKGRNKLKFDTRVDLVLKDNVVVKVIIYGLLMR